MSEEKIKTGDQIIVGEMAGYDEGTIATVVFVGNSNIVYQTHRGDEDVCELDGEGHYYTRKPPEPQYPDEVWVCLDENGKGSYAGIYQSSFFPKETQRYIKAPELVEEGDTFTSDALILKAKVFHDDRKRISIGGSDYDLTKEESRRLAMLLLADVK